MDGYNYKRAVGWGLPHRRTTMPMRSLWRVLGVVYYLADKPLSLRERGWGEGGNPLDFLPNHNLHDTPTKSQIC